jgi:hypothetical protein
VGHFEKQSACNCAAGILLFEMPTSVVFQNSHDTQLVFKHFFGLNSSKAPDSRNW